MVSDPHQEPPYGHHALIYRPAKNAMQSGRGKCDWILEFAPLSRQLADPLMGWAGNGDLERQFVLTFPTAEQAIAYATGRNIPYTLQPEAKRTIKPKSYADNFRFDRDPSTYGH